MVAHQHGHGSLNGKKIAFFLLLNFTSLQQHARRLNTALPFVRFQKGQETRAKKRMDTTQANEMLELPQY